MLKCSQVVGKRGLDRFTGRRALVVVISHLCIEWVAQESLVTLSLSTINLNQILAIATFTFGRNFSNNKLSFMLSACLGQQLVCPGAIFAKGGAVKLFPPPHPCKRWLQFPMIQSHSHSEDVVLFSMVRNSGIFPSWIYTKNFRSGEIHPGDVISKN